MFGSAAPATGFGAPGSGGFGKAPDAFPATNTTAPVGGGFGGVAAAPGATSSGFGTAATSGTGFGAPTATSGLGGFGGGSGFGLAGAPSRGFGIGAAAPVTAGGGWGAAPSSASTQFSSPQPTQPQQPTVTLQDFTRQSALASYLVKLDQAYNALHRNCHFRAFVYNSCGAGQVMDAIQKERYTAYLNGGGCGEEAYMRALHDNPDPTRLYPSPIHFSQELLRRTEKQREAVRVLQAKVEELLQDVTTVAAMDAANVHRQREVEQEEVMLRHRWYSLLGKMELLRRHGTSYGEESLLNSRVEQLRQLLHAPGRYGQLLGELRPFLIGEASRVAMLTQPSAHKSEAPPTRQSSTRGMAGDLAPAAWRNVDGQPLLRSEVDPNVMRDWIQFTKQMQDGIETLNDFLKTDLKEMHAIRDRVEAS